MEDGKLQQLTEACRVEMAWWGTGEVGLCLGESDLCLEALGKGKQKASCWALHTKEGV